MPPPWQRPPALAGRALPMFLPQRGAGSVLTSGPDGKHVAITRLKQTVKLVLNATKHLPTVWTAVLFFQNHLVFV